jgi:PAS domain S-box-containing protein
MSESEEELRETLLDLERARRAERQLRVQNEGLLKGLELLGSTKSNQEMFARLLELLREILECQEAFVLSGEPGESMEVVAATSEGFDEIVWEPGELTGRVLESEPVATFDAQLIPEWKPVLERRELEVTSALHIGLRAEPQASLLVCTHDEPGYFSPEHIQLGRRFSMLATQALVNRDLRELKLKAFERSVRDQFFRVSRDLMAILDVEGRIRQVNPAFGEELGYTDETLEGTELAEVAEPDHRERIEEAVGELSEAGDAVTVEARMQTREGERRWLQWNLSFADGDDLVYAAARDTTERRESEQKLRELNEELREARDEALAANKAKSAFLANMSHELRTPLNAVIGYAEMLQGDLRGEADPHHLEDLERIQVAGQRLMALIEDVLELNQIEAGRVRVDLETFSVPELLEDLRETVHPLMDRSGNTFEMEVPAEVGRMTSDLKKVRQVLFNLLSNAAKFTDDGRVSLMVRPRRTPTREMIEFEVSDTGVGMSDEELEGVFEAFAQADESTTREFEGTGLGLTITQHFCSLLGGSLDVESVEQEGTTFTVRLPRSWSESTETDEPSETERVDEELDGAGQEILIIDDDPDARDLLQRVFERAGYKTVYASNGSEGLHLAEQLQPDLITLDVIMPMMDGWTVLRRLRELPKVADTPTVLVTMADNRERGLAIGADEYVTKPVERDRLLEIVEQTLEK